MAGDADLLGVVSSDSHGSVIDCFEQRAVGKLPPLLWRKAPDIFLYPVLDALNYS